MNRFTLRYLFLFLCLGAFSLNAQTVQLGSGTTVSGTTAGSPINQWYRSLHGQIVYTAAELNAAGISGPGNITNFGFYIANGVTYPLPNWTLKMAHTTATTPAVYSATGLTTVYTNASYNPPAGGFNLLTLSTPFTWNGVDNILVDVCFDLVNPTYTSTGQVRTYSPAVTNGFRYVRSDLSSQCTVATNTNTNDKPQAQLTFVPASPCVAPPTAGNAVSSPASGCPSTVFSISLSGSTFGSGMSYQWQSSPNNTIWTNVSGATNAGLSTTQTGDTYYRAVVTCSGQSDTSNSVLVTTTPFYQCYCNTNLGGFCSTTDNINTVSITGTTLLNANTGCANNVAPSYSVYPASGSTTGTVMKGQTYPFNVTTTGSSIISVWIDYDHSGTFDATEWTQVATASTSNVPSTVNITIPLTALSGNTGMRIRSRGAGNTNGANDACSNFGSGETEDYTINIIPQSPYDVGITEILQPATTGCYSATQTVRVRVKAFGSSTIDFSTNNLSIVSSVSGTNPMILPVLNIASGTLAPNATLDTTITTTYNMSAPGTYTFNAKTVLVGDGYAGNDSISPVTINVSPGTAAVNNNDICGGSSINLSLTGYNGTIQWQGSTDGGATWVNETGAGNTAALYSTVPTDTTQYRALVCGTMTSNVVTVNVTVVQPPVSSNVTRCGAGPVTLTASGANTIQWFNTPTAGSALATGATYTPTVASSTTYYVQGSNGNSYNIGKVNNTSNTGGLFNNYGLVFSATTAFTLNSVKIYPVGTGNITIGLLNSANASINSRTIAVSGATGQPMVVYLGFYITPGSNYKLVMSSYSGVTGLYNDNTGVAFPYTAAGVASITSGWIGTGTSTTYYYFYDWNILTGCASSRTPVNVTVTPADTAIVTSSAASVCNGTPVTMTVSSNDPDYSYSWSPATGLNTTTGASVVATPSTATTYTVTATNTTSGCATSTVKALQVASMPAATATTTPSAVCRGASVQLNASTSGIAGYIQIGTGTSTNTTTGYPAPYGNWYWGARHQMLITAAELTAAGFTAGTSISSLGFDVTATNGSPALQAFEIKMGNTNLSALASFQTGLTIVKPAGAYTPAVGWNQHAFTTPFIWNGTSNVIVETCFNNSSYTNNASTRYSTTTFNSTIYYRADMSGVCSGTSATTSTQRPNMRFGTNLGYDYLWTPAVALSSDTIKNPVASPNQTTQYTVQVTNSMTGCSAYDTVEVTIYQPPVINLGANTGICAGDSIVLDAGPGMVTYSWFPGNQSTQTISVDTSGSYTATIVDNNGCVNSDTIAIVMNPVPTVVASGDTTQCGGTAMLTASANSGVNYMWNTGAFTNNITVSQSGTYVVTVTNAYGCQDTDSAIVQIDAIPTVTVGADTSFCPGGSVQLNANTNATAYLWTTNDTTQSITVSNAGTYAVTVQTAAGCTASDTVTVALSPVPVASAGADETICAGQGVVLTASGGNFFTWSTGANTPSVFVTPGNTTSYAVLVENAYGCMDWDSVTVFVNSNPVITAGTNQSVCAGSSTMLTATGGTNYVWSTTETTATITVTPGVTTTYTVSSTDANQCSGSATVAVIVNPIPVANAGSDKFICEGTSAMINGTGGGSYMWSPAAGLSSSTVANPTASPVTTTTYTLSVTSAAGCPSANADMVVVSVAPLPVASFTDVLNGTTATFTNSSSNALSYVWNFGDTTPVNTNSNPSHQYLNNGVFTVVLIASNGCGQDTATSTITISGIGIAEANLDRNTSVYPNPTKGSFTLQMTNESAGTVILRLLDVNGQLIDDSILQNAGTEIRKQYDITDMAKGVYFLHIVKDNTSIMKRIVLN